MTTNVGDPVKAQNPTSEQACQYAHDSYEFTYPLVLYYRTMHSQEIREGAAFGKLVHVLHPSA